MLQALRSWANAKPLAALTVIALVPRLMAAFFSGGYFAHDDHFLVIEPAASWVQDGAYSSWLPWNQGSDPRPSGHSFFYVGLHYLLFKLLYGLGLSDPKGIMVLVRLLHAIWSLVVVRVGYRIALHLSTPQVAWNTGLFLALFFFMPFLSVRNLVEVVCIPFLFLGAWRLIKNMNGPTRVDVFVAGIWIGLAMNVRFQTLFFAAGPGLALLLTRRWAPAFIYGLGVLLPLIIIQGGIDLVLWGRPFAEMGEYVLYNMANPTTYFDQPWYNYFLLLAGILIPPFSLAIMFGFFRRATPLLVWLPVVLFLAFHSYHPNKQERFLLPVLPLFFLLGYLGWEQWRARSGWWAQRERLWSRVLTFTWILNVILLLPITISYSKRSRVEAMYGLRDLSNLKGLVIEDSRSGTAPMPPLFYWGQWNKPVEPYTDKNQDLHALLSRYPTAKRPNVVLFIGTEELEQRIASAEVAMGPLHPLFRAEPGLLDRTIHWLNPVNRNETILVMRVVEDA